MQGITRRARRAIVAGAVLLSASAAWGGINDTWDWVNDPASGKPKRTLAIYYNFTEGDKLGDLTMKQVMDEAMANWNGVKGETGWEFVLGTAGSHDIEIKTGDISKPSGGAATTGSAGKDRTVSKLTITFDPTPAEGFQWGSNDDAKKNAVSNAKHELSHTLRLAHQGGTRSKTEKIADPQGHDTKDDDVLTISPTDKTEAKNAAAAPIKFAVGTAMPILSLSLAPSAYPKDIPLYTTPPCNSLYAPPNTFGNAVAVKFSSAYGLSLPDPDHAPAGIESMLKGVRIDVSAGNQPPIFRDSFFDIFFSYEDGIEGEGHLIDIADPDRTGIVESSLRPFLYDPIQHAWESLDASAMGGLYTLDTTYDSAHLQVPASLLGLFPNAGDPNTTTLYLALSGAAVPEPSSSLLVLAGLISGCLRRRKRD